MKLSHVQLFSQAGWIEQPIPITHGFLLSASSSFRKNINFIVDRFDRPSA
jgi:hypothetical protein